MRHVIGSLGALGIAALVALTPVDPLWLRIVVMVFAIIISIGFYANTNE